MKSIFLFIMTRSTFCSFAQEKTENKWSDNSLYYSVKITQQGFKSGTGPDLLFKEKIRFLQLLLTVVLLLSLSINAFGQTYQNVSDITKQKIDSTYLALIKKNKITGASITIVDNGKIVYSAGYGYADLKAKKPATDKTVYRIGSITKSFTALSVLQLYQDSVINIHEPLSKYLTDFSIKSPVTGEKQDMIIKDILSHISGMPCDILNEFFVPSPLDHKWAISQLNKQYTIAPSGFVMAYSNIGYALLGELVARTSGSSYEDYLSENIFKPLNMKSSGIYFNHHDNPEYSLGYIAGKPYKEPFLRDAPAGLIHSNVLDMANYTLMYLENGSFNNNRILNEKLINDMQKDYLSNTTLKAGLKCGYGLFINEYYVKDMETKDSIKYKYVGHGGDTYAYHAKFGFIPDLGVGAVILTNTDNGLKITNIPELLKVYLKYEKNEELLLAHNSEKENEYEPVTQNDLITGNYSSFYGFGEVKNVNKIKFSQSLTKTVLKKKPQEEFYKGKMKIFSFIPVKLKDKEYYFEKINETIYLKVRVPSKNMVGFTGEKVIPQTIHPSWKNAVGKYTMTGEVFEFPEKYPYNITEAKAELKIDNDVLVFEFKTSIPGMGFTFPLMLIDNENAKGYTYGRNTGYTVSLPDDNTLYFCGFTFKKCE